MIGSNAMTKVWFPDNRVRQELPLAAVGQLFFNHIDAWSVTGFIGAVALVAHQAVTFASALLLFSLMVGYWQAFVLNDYFDAPFDQAEPQKARHNFFIHHRQRIRALLALLLPMNLVVAWGFLQYGWHGLLVLLLCLVVMWAYSAPPLRIKSRPGWDLLVHGLFVESFPYWTCLYLTGATWGAFDYAILTLLILASLTAQLEQQVRDYAIDQRYERTFTTVVGRQRAFLILQLCTALLLAVGITAIFTGVIPWRFAPLGLIGLPIFLHRFFRPATVGRPLGLSLVALGAGALYIVWLLVQP